MTMIQIQETSRRLARNEKKTTPVEDV